MPVYLFTIHAYRSWMPDNPRGFVRRGEGIQPPDPGLAKAYNQSAVESPFLFGDFEQQVLAWIAHDCCTRRGWRLHFLAFEPTHVHALLSWRDETVVGEVFR